MVCELQNELEKISDESPFARRFINLLVNSERLQLSGNYNGSEKYFSYYRQRHSKWVNFKPKDLKNWIEHIENSYDIFSGFSSIDECLRTLLLPKSKYIFIYFNNQYYAVAYETNQKQIVVGKDVVWYRESSKFIKSHTHPENYPIERRMTKPSIAETLYFELKAISPNLKLYMYETVRKDTPIEVENEGNYIHFIVLLAITFKNMYFTKDDLKMLDCYFDFAEDYIRFLEKTDAILINPFRWHLQLKDGKIINYKNEYVPAVYGGWYSMKV